jgi:hypothetical protein
MPAGTANALTVVRVPHGQPKPSEQDLHAALARDRVRLHQSAQDHLHDVAVAGPYLITVDGQELDEYVIWER